MEHNTLQPLCEQMRMTHVTNYSPQYLLHDNSWQVVHTLASVT